jgi:hypothetical protein
MNAAASGQKTKSGTWQDTSADAAGTADFFRLFASDGTTCHLQGTAGMSAADLILDNTNVQAGQTVTINTFTWTDANA